MPTGYYSVPSGAFARDVAGASAQTQCGFEGAAAATTVSVCTVASVWKPVGGPVWAPKIMVILFLSATTLWHLGWPLVLVNFGWVAASKIGRAHV